MSHQNVNPVSSPAPQPDGLREDPGRLLSILSLVIAAVMPIAGVVLGYMGRKESRAAGFDGQLGHVGFILNIVLCVLGFIWMAFFLTFFVSAWSSHLPGGIFSIG